MIFPCFQQGRSQEICHEVDRNLHQYNHQAKAVCSENEEIANPCNGPALLKYKHLTAKGANPSIECPTGYEAVICNAHSYWTEL